MVHGGLQAAVRRCVGQRHVQALAEYEHVGDARQRAHEICRAGVARHDLDHAAGNQVSQSRRFVRGKHAALVEGAMRRLEASVDAPPTTRELLGATLRDDSPVPLTRRVAPDGTVLVLRLDGPDADADARGVGARTLAFGVGPRSCPAPHHALAIAGAIVDELRRAGPSSTALPTRPSNTVEAAHADR